MSPKLLNFPAVELFVVCGMGVPLLTKKQNNKKTHKNRLLYRLGWSDTQKICMPPPPTCQDQRRAPTCQVLCIL